MLDLFANQIGDEGVAALVAPGEGVLPSLKHLDLEYNDNISDAGFATLVAALDSCIMPALEHLMWNHFFASDEAHAALAQACKRRQIFTTEDD